MNPIAGHRVRPLLKIRRNTHAQGTEMWSAASLGPALPAQMPCRIEFSGGYNGNGQARKGVLLKNRRLVFETRLQHKTDEVVSMTGWANDSKTKLRVKPYLPKSNEML